MCLERGALSPLGLQLFGIGFQVEAQASTCGIFKSDDWVTIVVEVQSWTWVSIHTYKESKHSTTLGTYIRVPLSFNSAHRNMRAWACTPTIRGYFMKHAYSIPSDEDVVPKFWVFMGLAHTTRAQPQAQMCKSGGPRERIWTSIDACLRGCNLVSSPTTSSLSLPFKLSKILFYFILFKRMNKISTSLGTCEGSVFSTFNPPSLSWSLHLSVAIPRTQSRVRMWCRKARWSWGSHTQHELYLKLTSFGGPC